MSEMALALFVCCAAGCAPASASTHARNHQPGASATRHTITAAPTILRVELDDLTREELARRLSERSLEITRLIIRDVRPNGAEALKGIRLFIEKPDADMATPTADRHYAGSFVLGFSPPETVQLNIASALSRLWAS